MTKEVEAEGLSYLKKNEKNRIMAVGQGGNALRKILKEWSACAVIIRGALFRICQFLAQLLLTNSDGCSWMFITPVFLHFLFSNHNYILFST